MSLLAVPFARNIDDVEIERDEFAPGQILEGEPEMGTAILWESKDGTAICGVWDVTPGVFAWDFEADELFVVLRGSAEITVEGGSPIAVGPGDMAVFKPGDRTVWRVVEPLRKVFHIAQS